MEGMDRRQNTKAAANNFLKTLRAFFSWAKNMGLLQDDPTLGVKPLKTKTEGHQPWSDSDIASYREYWGIGTRERLALELLIHTGLRRSDIVRLGPEHIKGEMIEIRTQKTGAIAYIPISPDLQKVIAELPVGGTTFFCTQKGNPMTKESFGNFFRDACIRAGVKGRSHGIRKTRASKLAEAGASEMELQATFAWTTSQQSQIYTRAASKKVLAERTLTKHNGNESPRTSGEFPAPQNSNIENAGENPEQNGSGGPTRTRTWNQTVMSRQL